MAENATEIPEGITCPRQLYGHDLKKFINSKSEAGHQVIVLGDFNSNYVDLQEWINNIGCKDIFNKNMVSVQSLIKDPTQSP